MPENVVRCMSIANMKRPNHLAQIGACFECKAGIWMAPSTVHLIFADTSIRPLCENCCDKYLAKHDGVIFALAPGAIQEINAAAKKVETN